MTPGRATGIGLVLAAVVAAAAWAQPGKDAAAAAEPVMRQLEAFRRGDFDAAYAFASQEIRQLFDREAFERMVKAGYPEIARSTYAVVADSQVAASGNVYLRLKIRGVNGNSVEAVYEMVWQAGEWKINGVVATPDPGLVSAASSRAAAPSAPAPRRSSATSSASACSACPKTEGSHD
jgi:ABC-type transporter MlaC component